MITGFAFTKASEKDQPMADTFLALRRLQSLDLPTVGWFTYTYSLADNGFEGAANVRHCNLHYGAMVLAAPAPFQQDT